MNRNYPSRLLSAAAVAAFAALSPVQADTTNAETPAADFGRFGGKAALDTWAQHMGDTVRGDVRVNQAFGFNDHAERQLQWQKDMVQIVAYGPVGQSQANAVALKYRLTLTDSQSNAVIDDTYLACEAAQISYDVCNQIVSALAPFERAAARA